MNKEMSVAAAEPTPLAEEREALYSGLVKLNQFFADSVEESNLKHK